MYVYDIVLSVMDMILEDETSIMALFTAYIDDYPGYEIFCGEIPVDCFDWFKDELQKSDVLRKAFEDSGVLDHGVESYIEKTVESYEMWYRLSAGIEKIANNPHLTQALFDYDRHFLESTVSLWQLGMLDRETWTDAAKKYKEETNW